MRRKQSTSRWEPNRAAVELNDVDILAHPGFLTMEEAELAKAHEVILELSARTFHMVTNGHVARTALEVGNDLVVDSDAHATDQLLSTHLARQVARGAGVPESAVARVLRETPQRLLPTLRQGLTPPASSGSAAPARSLSKGIHEHPVPGSFRDRPCTPVKGDGRTIPRIGEDEDLVESTGSAVGQQMLNERPSHAPTATRGRHRHFVQEHLGAPGVHLAQRRPSKKAHRPRSDGGEQEDIAPVRQVSVGAHRDRPGRPTTVPRPWPAG